MAKRPTIVDVARLARVSISTVSRYLKNPLQVSEKLRERIERAIKELGYKPSRIAQGLRTGDTKMIGFIVPDITNPAFLMIVKGAEDFLRKKGYSFIIGGTDHRIEDEVIVFESLMLHNVDGIIMTCAGNENNKLRALIEKYQPKMVFVDRRYEGMNIPYVGVDNCGGVERMVDYLVQTGHRSFVYLCGDITSSARERLNGFLKGMRKHNIEDYQVLYGEFTFESGYRLVKKLTRIPDAIMAGNDLMAFGAIEALKEAGVKIPDDVSITGFDDMFFSRYYQPSLTTVRQDLYEMGRLAGKVLLSLISGKKIRKKEYILPTELVIRDSTKDRREDRRKV